MKRTAAVRAFGPNMVDDIGIYGELKESQVIRKEIQKAAKGKGKGRGEGCTRVCRGRKRLGGRGNAEKRTGGMFYKSSDDRKGS